MSNIEIGDRVQINFNKPIEPMAMPRDAQTGKILPWKFGGELMWVLVTGNPEENSWSGRLLNNALSLPLKRDTKVQFNTEEILVHKKGGKLARLLYQTFNWLAPGWDLG